MVTQLKQRQFRPHPVATVMGVVFTVIFASLGVWQLDRVSQKEQLAAEFAAQRALPVVDLGSTTVDIDTDRYRDASVVGEFVGAHQILLDNVVFDGRPGFQVLAPLRLADSDRYLLIDRGWAPQGTQREALPEVPPPQGVTTVSGWLGHPRSKPVIVPGPVAADQMLWPYLDMDALSDRLGSPLPDYVVHATNDAELRHKLPEFDAKTGMHIGYAIQWFAFAAAAAGTYVAVSMRKTA